MKKTIKFSKAFVFCAILSCVLICAGVVSVILRGINFGLDFKSGMIEEIRIAPAVLELTYDGSATISLDVQQNGITAIVTGTSDENQTLVFDYAENSSIGELAQKLESIEGVSAKVLKDFAIPQTGLFVRSDVSSVLKNEAFLIHADDENFSCTSDDIRNALSIFEGVSVKELGTEKLKSFQIRLPNQKIQENSQIEDENQTKIELEAENFTPKNDFQENSLEKLTFNALSKVFGEQNVVISSSSSIGSQFSKNLVVNSIVLVLATLVLIWIYAAIRFHWDFALAAVVAIIHDSLIMVSFVSWTQIEFSTTTLAAILTIIGYSINATVVIFDRVRSSMKTLEAKNFLDVINYSLTATLSRSILTTITTLFSVLALFFFTTGSIHDFALVLSVGLVSGLYSSIFISGGIVALTRKNWKYDEKSTGARQNAYAFPTS